MAITKLLTPGSVSVHSETGRLKLALVAGLPSVEQELVQLYPTSKSLFLDRMDVQTARAELQQFSGILAQNGTEVIVMKEELAKLLAPTGQSKDEILRALFKKADDISEAEGSKLPEGIKDKIAHLFELDTQIYGHEGAASLAHALCLSYQYPLGNVIYARDQTNVVNGHRIVSSMAYSIRQDEVGLYEMVYNAVLGPHPKITIPSGEIFEGGSLIVHRGTVYIDVDPRTTEGAAMHIFTELAKSYPDLKFAIVKNGSRGEAFEQQQSTMHLDMYLMPVGEHTMAVCGEEAEKRKAISVEVKDGVARKAGEGVPLTEYLSANGYDLIFVSKADQANFGTNFIGGIGESKAVIMSISDRSNTTGELQKKGIPIISTPVDALTDGFGGTHCSVSSLLRA